MYLRVETMADLTNAHGDKILASVYFCMEEGRIDTSTQWPYQPRPGPRHREKWQQFLDMLSYVPTYTCLLYTSPSPRDGATSRMPSSA